MEIDFATMTKEQLIHLVQVRGQALTKTVDTDNALWEKLTSGELEEGSFEAWIEAKQAIMDGLGLAEEKIMAGQSADTKVN